MVDKGYKDHFLNSLQFSEPLDVQFSKTNILKLQNKVKVFLEHKWNIWHVFKA